MEIGDQFIGKGESSGRTPQHDRGVSAPHLLVAHENGLLEGEGRSSDATKTGAYLDTCVRPADRREPFDALTDKQDVKRSEPARFHESFEAGQADPYSGVLKPTCHADRTSCTVPAEVGLAQLDLDLGRERRITNASHRPYVTPSPPRRE